jgi:hypothetical protein
MSSLSIWIDRLRLRVPEFEDRTRARLRLAHQLSQVDLHPPGLPPQSVMVIRRLVAACGFDLRRRRVDPRRDQALRRSVESLVARAGRVVGGEVVGAADVVIFRDFTELLACAGVESWLGRFPLAWYWSRVSLNGLRVDASAHWTDLWRHEPRRIPGAVSTLASWGRATRVLEAIPDTTLDELSRLALTSHGHSLSAAQFESVGVSADRRIAPRGPEAAEPTSAQAAACRARRRSTYGPALHGRAKRPSRAAATRRAGVPSALRPGVTRLLRIAAVLQRAPHRATSAGTVATLCREWNVEDLARGSWGGKPSGRETPSRPSAAAAGAPLSVGSPRSCRETSVDVSARPVPDRDGTRGAAPDTESGVLTEVASESRNAVADGIRTKLGGVFYLLNLAQRLGAPDRYGSGEKVVGPWAWCECVARSLLVEADGEVPADPIWQVLPELDGRGVEPLPGGVQAIVKDDFPRIRADLLRTTASDDVRACCDEILRVAATIHVGASEVHIVFALNDISIAARVAGLDANPGWWLELGREVGFHFI